MKKLNDEQRKLIEDNYKLIRFLYRRSYTRVCSWEVFQGLGHEAMCKAALGYDPSKGKFTTYLLGKLNKQLNIIFAVTTTMFEKPMMEQCRYIHQWKIVRKKK